MAWIESHQSLLTHRKTTTLAALLELDRLTVIGHLHALWWWALDNAPDGNLTRIPYPAIAEGCCYKGDQNLLIQSLVKAGFIDRRGRRLRLHDWDDYAGKLIDRRERNRERMRQERAAHSATNVQRTVQSTCKATVPNPTEPNSTVQNLTPPIIPPLAGGDGGDPVSSKKTHPLLERFWRLPTPALERRYETTTRINRRLIMTTLRWRRRFGENGGPA